MYEKQSKNTLILDIIYFVRMISMKMKYLT